jgi:lysophospholipase L1-like esterase
MSVARLALYAALVAPACVFAESPVLMPDRVEGPPLEPYKIILVGDSTTAPHSGWGGAFCAHHVKWRVACLNLARGARSTRSFRSEGAWAVALGEMKVPGYTKIYVLIQMGHNDQARNKPERWTEEATEFPENLRRFVKETRATGAVPVLVTPLSRRDFKDGTINNTLASWSDQVRKVARELQVPLIDLNAESAQAVQKLGPVAAMALAQLPPKAEEKAAAAKGTTLPPPPAPASAALDGGVRTDKTTGARGQITRKFDYTHLGPEGAELFATLIAEDLATVAPELAALLVP